MDLEGAIKEVAGLAAQVSTPYLADLQWSQNKFGLVSNGNHFDQAKYRLLSDHEILRLKVDGNSASDWNSIKVAKNMEADDLNRIQGCSFSGVIVIETLCGTVEVEGAELPCGLYRSSLVNSYIGHNVLIQDTILVSNTVIGEGSALVGCGMIISSRNRNLTYGNGVSLPVGVEVGGRDIKVYADMSYEAAVAVGSYREDAELLRRYEAAVDCYVQAATGTGTVIMPGCKLFTCQRIAESYVGPFAVIKDATVEDSSILSSREEPSRVLGQSIVRHSVLQWSSEVDRLSLVESSFLCDHSHVDKHGKLLDSLLGPNSGVAEGEVTSSFVGPFVGFHHQALLIACFWPSGKGNIGYGANVGSNHTLKAPDQEIWPGEGVFFGLSVSIKFPSNFRDAPYSVIATGVSTLPQTCAMPFSLINTPGEVIPGLSPAFNEISPGWVLGDCIYTVLRNEMKFSKRNKSKRTKITAEVLRPSTVRLMQKARESLEKAEGTAKLKNARGDAVFTSSQIPEIGKNYMRESARKAGIKAYKYYATFYALKGLLREVKAGLDVNSVLDGSVESKSGKEKRWDHELSILRAEFPGSTALDLLPRVVEYYREIAKSAEKGKSRDDVRGEKTIPDYQHVHASASEDPCVIAAYRTADEVQSAVSAYFSRM